MRREDKERRAEAADRAALRQLASRLFWLRNPEFRDRVLVRIRKHLGSLLGAPSPVQLAEVQAYIADVASRSPTLRVPVVVPRKEQP